MPEEAAEQVALEVVKEVILKGGEHIWELSEKASKKLFETLGSGINKGKGRIDARRNSGQMDVKRLYRVSDGELNQTEISNEKLASIVEKMKDQGINFAVEKGTNGKNYLHFRGKDKEHVHHILNQSIEELGLKYEDQLPPDVTIVNDPALDTIEFPVQEKIQEKTTGENSPVETHSEERTAANREPEQANPASEDYTPSQEEAEYLEAAGYTADQQETPEHEQTHAENKTEQEDEPDDEARKDGLRRGDENRNEPASEDYTPSQEEAEYLTAAGYTAEQTRQQLHPEQELTHGENTPEHVETVSESSNQSTPDELGSAGEESPDADSLTDTEPSQANETDTHSEMRSKTVNGKTKRTMTTKQKLRSAIIERRNQKMAAHKNLPPRTRGQHKPPKLSK